MIVFDAGVLIAHLDPDDAFHAGATGFLEEHEEFEFAANALTVAECLVRPQLSGRAASVLAAFDRIVLRQIDLVAADALGIAEVRAATRLRMPAALVLYTAERIGAGLATTDQALARAANERGLTAYSLRIT